MSDHSLPPSDGRLQRSERSREAIVNAVLELVREGVLIPTAQQVAERAGVGIRSVFRHYSDMESLFLAMSERWLGEATNYLSQPPERLPLDHRATELARRRSALFEHFAPIQRSKLVLAWRSQTLRLDQENGHKALRNERSRWLPELDHAPDSMRNALDATLSFANWNHLREESKLDAEATTAAIEVQVRALLRAARADGVLPAHGPS